jgi:hypothetical protein
MLSPIPVPVGFVGAGEPHLRDFASRGLYAVGIGTSNLRIIGHLNCFR